MIGMRTYEKTRKSPMTKSKTSSTLRRAFHLTNAPTKGRLVFTVVALCALVLPATSANAQVLAVSKTRITVANAPTSPKTPGKVKMDAVLSDGDNQNFVNDMLANTATISIVDSGTYALTGLAIGGCSATKGGVRCVSDATGFRVKFVGVQNRNFPDVYRIKLKVRDLTDAETGLGPLVAPVFVTLDQTPTLSRTDEHPANDCAVRAQGNSLRCKAP